MDNGHHNCRDYLVEHSEDRDPPRAALIGGRQNASPMSRAYSRSMPFRFFDLPSELREKIYLELLPTCVQMPDTGPSLHAVESWHGQTLARWHRGQTNLLIVSRKMHEDCAALLYGRNSFSIFVTYDQILFRYCWVLDNGLTPVGELDILTVLPSSYLARMRRLDLVIDHPDGYTGMIKYNVGGAGLTYGLKMQVKRLSDAFKCSGAPELFAIRACLRYGMGRQHHNGRKGDDSPLGRARIEEVEVVLEPLMNLPKSRTVQIYGAVTTSRAASLRKVIEI